jgi:hypothetical protein
MSRSIKLFSVIRILLLTFVLGSCRPTIPTNPPPDHETSAAETAAPTIPAQTTATSPAVPALINNPLTGLPVADPSLLQIPALLVSISHFPVEARPQAGLSFAPYVFEVYITEGATRFLTTFYGEFPAPEIPITGNCDVRKDIFTQTATILGNQAWHDENQNGIHEIWERGIGGMCVNLYDANGTVLQQTTTDSNGYYGFNVHPGKYILEFLKPPGMEFTQKDSGEEGTDSDVVQGTGRTDLLDLTTSLLNVDAGLIPLTNLPPAAALPPAKVGPVRSGRLIYADIAAFFPDSCLIYAFASAEVQVHLPQCAFVEHDIQGGGYMLGIPEMIQYAKDSRKPGQEIDYTGNVYSADPPEGGLNASALHVFIAWLNQSAWKYDPLYEGWWRYVDTADEDAAGVVHPEIDRLTGRQLHFENVIVLFARHDVVSPTNLDIHLEQDWLGDALLFRDQRMYNIRWSTVATDEEFQTGRRHPIRFLNLDDRTSFPLKPGHTWILIVTPETKVIEQSAGEWLLQFSQPPGAK